MCDCIKEIEKKVLEKFPTHNGKKVEKAKMDTCFIFSEGKVTSGTKTDVQLELVGQKKKIPVAINHSYCPFCGEEHKTE